MNHINLSLDELKIKYIKLLSENKELKSQLDILSNCNSQNISQTEQIIRSISEKIRSKAGDLFFETFITCLSKELNVDYCFVGKISIDQLTKKTLRKIETVYLSGQNKIIQNFSYDLLDTPCNNVFAKDLCIYTDQVQELFPNDFLLQEMNIKSYAGLPLFDSSANPIGILVILDSKPILDKNLISAVMSYFGDRVSAELERLLYINKLQNSEIRFLQLSEISNSWIWETTLDGFITYSNSSSEKIIGFHPVELINKKYLHDLVTEEKKESFRETLNKLFEKKSAFTDQSNLFNHKNGKPIRLSLNGTPIMTLTGEIIGFRGIIEVENN